MKKVILILSMILMSNLINAQFMENPNITKDKHYFLPAYASGVVSSSIVMVGVNLLTDNRYIVYASGFVASVAAGWAKNRIDVHNGGEFSNSEIWNSGFGGLTSILAFHIVIGKPKKQEKLIDF